MTVAQHSSNKTYIVIWVWLMALVLAGVGIAELHISKTAIVATVLVLSTIKAFLVAMHYMHLKTDRRMLAFVLIAPFILVALALCVVFSSRLIQL